MCIAICKPKDVIIKKRVLKTCFENNPHGAGMAYPSKDGSKVIIDKGYFHFRAFWKKFQAVQENKPMLIHFRVATSGVIDKTNCHPWRINAQHALIHNGNVASKIGLDSDEFSDTGLFVQHLLKPAFSKNTEFWKTEGWKWTIERAIGDSNKIAIIDNNGIIKIFNEEKGEKEHGVWFSNDTYKNARKSIAKIGDSWIEYKNGKKVLARRKGNVINYYPVKNPLTNEKDINDKIMKFAHNCCATIAPKTLDELRTEEDAEFALSENESDYNASEVDVTQMI